jgi:PDZ domain-containing protein
MSENQGKHRRWLGWLAAAIALIIIACWPTNYYIESPGSAQKVSELMTSQANKPDSHFYMLTVAERPAGLLDYGLSFLRSDESRISKQELLAGQSTKSYEMLQHYYMTTSQNNALYYAAKKAGRHPQLKYLGIYVLDLLPGSSFKHKLSVGDTIIKINNQHFDSTPAMMKYLRQQKNWSESTDNLLAPW